ncbi:hypothetical protein Tco_0283019 [Tanacetum coccineum]
MTSFDCRLKAIKACSACGNLHTSAFCCSKEKLKNKILVPMPESSQQHIKIERICFDCGDLLHGLNCLECDLTRKILEKAFQKFQNTSKSSNDNSNVVNAPREPFVVKQDPSVNSSQKSPLIDQKCCCECGDSLDGIFCQQCTCKSCGKGAHVGYNCPPKTLIISNPEPTKQTINEIPQARKSGVDNRRITLIVIRARANSAVVVSLMEFVLVVLMEMEIKSIFQLPMQKKEEEKRIAERAAAKERYWKFPFVMMNETIPLHRSHTRFIKVCVEILSPIPVVAGVTKLCDMPVHDNSPPLDQSEDFFDSNVDSTSTDEDSFSSIGCREFEGASPPQF